MFGSGPRQSFLGIQDSRQDFLNTMTSGLQIKRFYVEVPLVLQKCQFEEAIEISLDWMKDGYFLASDAYKTPSFVVKARNIAKRNFLDMKNV